MHWTQDDFDSLSWHDNHVHGLRMVAGEGGAGELEFDIDHILEWLESGASFRYRIAPALLRFHAVTDLRLAIDWGAASAAFGPFSIQGIERRLEPRSRYTAICWRIPVNFPPGEIAFEAAGFDLHLSGSEVLVDHQCLTSIERGRLR
jgi:hypothetical protein